MDEYEILYNNVVAVSQRCFVRIYSDKTASVSLYIDDKHLAIEGDYTAVLDYVKYLKEHNGGNP